MNCYNHPSRPAVAQCVDCHKGLCVSCAQKYTISICDECNDKRRSKNLSYYIKQFVICIILFIIGYNLDIFGSDRFFGAYMLMCAYGGWKAINQFFPTIFVWFNVNALLLLYLIKLFVQNNSIDSEIRALRC